MENLELTISDGAGAAEIFIIPVSDNDTYDILAGRIHEQAHIDGDSVIESILEDELPVNLNERIEKHKLKHPVITFNKVCVSVNFETETAQHWFPVHSSWHVVHRWSCKKFKVAKDACVNLELHQDTPNGPAVNERNKIGDHDDCMTVWLVKPGPEPNG